MSIAGIRSNRGDTYQTLVAFDWALMVLADPEYQWLEIDSTTHSVDDVVIGKSDETLICCQCKKNQTDFRSWSFSDLREEIDKAILELSRNSRTQVRFYSRNNFGDVAKLCEFCTAFSNEIDYRSALTADHGKTDRFLADRIDEQACSLSTFEFLRRTVFETTPDFDQLKRLRLERLRQMASNSEAAYNAMWTALDNLGARTGSDNPSASIQHRLTKEYLNKLVEHAGSMLAPTISTADVRRSFSSTSSIGRSWVQDVAGQCIPRPIVEDLMAAIDARKRSILLTGLPGSGKTCVILSLQTALEQRAKTQTDMLPLFIQSREYADLKTADDRETQGLSKKWVEQAARLAEDAHVVVIIDSLDVLSIAREHCVLKYFLAQIDRLLLIPNVTVVTACRDFDRQYDRRIAVRSWDLELKCMPFDWDREVAPMLDELGLDSNSIDAVTRDLICIPRELALYVGLARHQGSFNIVTSQALAQRYLDTIVRDDPEMGDQAMEAIEAIADDMLRSRSLSIPHQRFEASNFILRKLQSLNVLLDTGDGNLKFGHQTLLDVLVISGAIRKNVSLNKFIQDLSPVPFVRPFIRGFVEHLASRERREFRKQLRAVLIGGAAFHIRRLVAESFAQQSPHDDDWLMISDLRCKHREIFQVIYTDASSLQWHEFWLAHLVPEMKEVRDTEGLITHVHRIAQWANADAKGVLAFWEDTLSLSWLDAQRVVGQVLYSLSKFEDEYLHLLGSLLDRLLGMPKPRFGHQFGHTLARCVAACVVGDDLLWRYIAGEITEGDMIKYHFDNKLHCRPHDFGHNDESFLKQRMVHSTVLLDLALEAIEKWSHLKSTQRGQTRVGYHSEFLRDTSYANAHSQCGIRNVSDEMVLLSAIKVAIIDHTRKHSDWWQKNCKRLCFNQEMALCYFGVLAVTDAPHSNLSLISRVLCDTRLLKSELSYELGTLIQSAFVLLDGETQDTLMELIQNLWKEQPLEEDVSSWILKNRAEYVSAIPCHLRSAECQAILDRHESIFGTLVREPSIDMRGGMISAPFSYELFLGVSDDDVIRLLTHYSGYDRSALFDFLSGGEKEVGWQLLEASSRHPSRFLAILTMHWRNIQTRFRNAILDGIASYLAHRYGNLHPNDSWKPIDEPDAQVFANQILDELERHSYHWRLTRSMAKALESCANVVQDTTNAGRLVFFAISFINICEKSSAAKDMHDLIQTGINMEVGNVAEALMILANRLQENRIEYPQLLAPTLRRFASIEHPAIRALILRRLSYLQYLNPVLGWEIFERVTHEDAVGLWQSAEQCLYYAYHDNFAYVAPCLKRICHEGNEDDMETWGRISALCVMDGHIDFGEFISELHSLGSTSAWGGAASVWTHEQNIREHREQCIAGIDAGLNADSPHSIAVARGIQNIFQNNTPPVAIPTEMIQRYFSVFKSDTENNHSDILGFDEWLNATSQRAPDDALAAVEIYLAYVSHNQSSFYGCGDHLVQLITRLFAEAEEREESDHGEMLRRVVSLQDLMLSLGVSTMNEWLRAAESP